MFLIFCFIFRLIANYFYALYDFVMILSGLIYTTK